MFKSFLRVIVLLGAGLFVPLSVANSGSNPIKDQFDHARQITASSIPNGTNMFRGTCVGTPNNFFPAPGEAPHGASGPAVLCLYSSNNTVALRMYPRDRFYCPNQNLSDEALAPLDSVGNNDLGNDYEMHKSQDHTGYVESWDVSWWHIIRSNPANSNWLVWTSYDNAYGNQTGLHRGTYEFYCDFSATPAPQLPHADSDTNTYTIPSAVISSLESSSVTLFDPSSGRTWTANILGCNGDTNAMCSSIHSSLLTAMGGTLKADVTLNDDDIALIGADYTVVDVKLHQ